MSKRTATLRIGKSHGQAVELDVARLVDTRLLLQANSGGGKSWLLRLMAEQSVPMLPTIILDPEGEYLTLREKVDVVIVGSEGEIAADPRTAALLARRLAELSVSAVINLYDLNLHERRRFVRLFCEALMALPRERWSPRLVVIDEAHLFCPERSAGESEATDSVIAVASQGRKRGLGLILSTQRLTKLHKDAAAELNNVIVGRTWLNNDQSRVGDVLGYDKAERTKLRDLAPGQFHAFGPAFNLQGVFRFTSDQVQTTHPDPNSRRKLTAPQPSRAIRAVVGQLAELAKQSEEEARTLEELRTQNATLKRELKAAQKSAPPPSAEQTARAVNQAVAARDKHWQTEVAKFERARRALTEKLGKIRDLAIVNGEAPKTEPPPEARVEVQRPKPVPAPRPASEAAGRLPICERKILTALSQYYPATRTQRQLGILTGYAHTSGSFRNSLSALRSRGWVIGGGEAIAITEPGLEGLGPVEPLPSGRELLEHWLGQLGKCEREVLQALWDIYPDATSKEAVAEQTGYAATSGSFRNALSKLRTLELISRGAELQASPAFFESP